MIRRSAVRSQIRWFALIWVGITAMMALVTFFAIYLTYGGGALPPADNLTGNLAIPLAASGTPIVAVPSDTPTSPPTVPPQPTETLATMAADDIPEVAVVPSETPTPTVVPTTLPVDDKQFAVGIQVEHSPDFNPDYQNGWMDLVDQLNMDWFKQQVRWELLEPEKGQINWAVLDLVLPTAAEHNNKVMLSIVTAPDWARESGISLDRHGPPADPQDYANFVVAILERYPGMVHAVEVWNEQNLDREWTSMQGLKASNYINLLRTTYQAIKAVDPGVIVISGALSPTGFNDGIGAWDDFIYMDQLISAGLLNYADCIGAHHNGYNVGPSYTWDAVPNDPTAAFRGPFDNPHHSWTFRSTLQTYANKIELAGGDQKLCITEFGWAVAGDIPGFATAGFEFANDNSLEEQKTWTVEALSNMEEWDIVWLAFIWNLNYGPQAGWSPENDNVPYSFIGPDFAFRPVYDGVKDWVSDYKERTEQ
jgi:polysaccharide biosynthesis protein PslG